MYKFWAQLISAMGPVKGTAELHMTSDSWSNFVHQVLGHGINRLAEVVDPSQNNIIVNKINYVDFITNRYLKQVILHQRLT